MAGRRRESESAARARYVHGGRGEGRQQCEELPIRKVMDKRRRWSRLILIIVIHMYTVCMITVSK